MSDLISRQDAINTVMELTRKVNEGREGQIGTIVDADVVRRIKALPSAEPMTGEWIPVSERLPKDLEVLNVTWVNHNPPSYYEHMKDKPYTGFVVWYRDDWYWWDSTIVDTLAEYGSRDFVEPIDKDIEIIAWMPLPKPYREDGDTHDKAD